MVSPYSIAVALGMTLTGAGGRTAEEMRHVLGAETALHAGLNALTQHVGASPGASERADGSEADIALGAANQLFGQRGVGWERPFLDALAAEYGAGIRDVDFATAADAARVLINDWVGQQTHDRITDLIPAGVLDELTRLVLVNAHLPQGPVGSAVPEGAHGAPSRSTGPTAAPSTPTSCAAPASPAVWAGGRLAGRHDRVRRQPARHDGRPPRRGRLSDVEALVASGRLPELLPTAGRTGSTYACPSGPSAPAPPSATC